MEREKLPEKLEAVERALERAVPNLEDRQLLGNWILELEKRCGELDVFLRKQELDFTTILEVANQINARSLDPRGLESFIHFVTSAVRGQFGVSKVYLIREVEWGSGKLALYPARVTEEPVLEFHRTDEFGLGLLKSNRPILLEETGPEFVVFDQVRTLREMGIAVLVPLLHISSHEGTQLEGVLCLGKRYVRSQYTESERNFLRLLGDMVAISLHNAVLHHRAITDGLTRLYSRGHFDVELAREVARLERTLRGGRSSEEVSSLCLILMDIDHFKQCNDRYGHQAGDAVLRAMSGVLQGCVRKSDILARYGGEEFGLIAPDTRKVDAVFLAERLRHKLEGLQVPLPDGTVVGVTASFGVAAFPQDASSQRDLVAKADQALYDAKEQGRNRVASSAAPSEGTSAPSSLPR